MISIASEGTNLADISAELSRRLRAFNEAIAGPARTRHVVLTVRDEEGHLIAGLTAETVWNALYVDLLWIDDAYRGQGYGTSLLRQAENVAIDHQCTCVYLSTFTFQAPAFYAARGYSPIGELANVPAGWNRQWFCKTVTAD